MHDPVVTRYRHLDVFRHACYLEARTPRVRLRDGRVARVEPGWAGKLSGFTLLLEAMVVMLVRQMPLRRRPAPSASRAPECTTVCYASACGPHGVASWICARMLILHLNIISTLREFNLIPTSLHRLANGTPACAQIMN
ncbi:hypothetical protein D5R55_24645 [Burkholderia cenocepacia]|uniref:Uncharacterized protein n=1 Tax=Burkholderia cenocepacia TaxID=95486 RepID=A0A3S9NEW2_9BURK|nr:hypothetical protein D5R55_24645 [Burkholderia cenocepacia]